MSVQSILNNPKIKPHIFTGIYECILEFWFKLKIALRFLKPHQLSYKSLHICFLGNESSVILNQSESEAEADDEACGAAGDASFRLNVVIFL